MKNVSKNDLDTMRVRTLNKVNELEKRMVVRQKHIIDLSYIFDGDVSDAVWRLREMEYDILEYNKNATLTCTCETTWHGQIPYLLFKTPETNFEYNRRLEKKRKTEEKKRIAREKKELEEQKTLKELLEKYPQFKV